MSDFCGKPLVFETQPLVSCDKETDVSSCNKETHASSHDMYDTLLPLFGGGSSHVDHHEAHHQPFQVSNEFIDQPGTNADVHGVLYEERVEIEEARNMPKWLV